MANGEDSVIKVSQLVELLKQIEWDAKLARLALLQSDQATTFKVSAELVEHLKSAVTIANHTTPPC
jgi:hypothetical protein